MNLTTNPQGWTLLNKAQAFVNNNFTLDFNSFLKFIVDETPASSLFFTSKVRSTLAYSSWSTSGNVSNAHFAILPFSAGMYTIDITVFDDGVQYSDSLVDLILPGGGWDMQRVAGPQMASFVFYLEVSSCTICNEKISFLSASCTNVSDSTCAACSQYCALDEYISSSCTSYGDTVCSPCSLRCPPYFKMNSSCDGISNVECVPCQRKPVDYYDAGGCSGLDNIDYLFLPCPQLADLIHTANLSFLLFPAGCPVLLSATILNALEASLISSSGSMSHTSSITSLPSAFTFCASSIPSRTISFSQSPFSTLSHTSIVSGTMVRCSTSSVSSSPSASGIVTVSTYSSFTASPSPCYTTSLSQGPILTTTSISTISGTLLNCPTNSVSSSPSTSRSVVTMSIPPSFSASATITQTLSKSFTQFTSSKVSTTELQSMCTTFRNSKTVMPTFPASFTNLLTNIASASASPFLSINQGFSTASISTAPSISSFLLLSLNASSGTALTSSTTFLSTTELVLVLISFLSVASCFCFFLYRHFVKNKLSSRFPPRFPLPPFRHDEPKSFQAIY